MKTQNNAPACGIGDTPLVSVVMPAYKCEAYIGKAIESVMGQTYPHWELIVVNDSSPDSTAAVAEEYAARDERVRVVHQIPNAGCAKARNMGIAAAKGAYIAFLDSDDVWVSDKLEKQLCLLTEKGAEIAYGTYDFIDENGEQIKRPFVVAPETNYKKMLGKNEIGCSTALVRADLLKAHPFRPEYYHEDYVLWMELLALPVTAVGLTEVVTHYRVIADSRSYDKGNAARERWRIYRGALRMSFFASAWAFVKYAVNGVKKHYFSGS